MEGPPGEQHVRILPPVDFVETAAFEQVIYHRFEGNYKVPSHAATVRQDGRVGYGDSLATHHSLGLNTSAGSLALVTAKVPHCRWAIIISKTNLSEFSNVKGSLMRAGWSTVGGQTMSAYVDQDQVDATGGRDGHGSPAGSATGSAVGVSAGRGATLYTIRPSIGRVPQDGIVPHSPLSVKTRMQP
ncbi:hypothetical protein O1611_g222 [Lasiodiplodia mahajangana]|uniref:Uncharacterized protein n=1 Tax=Lasiodiplodia mahajangana TaxID=1108764 RepID=A0ACC2K1P0_9PEZI|nr:hypothetical protein O1611_g222 [Lasiodiplodia mahajangana]